MKKKHQDISAVTNAILAGNLEEVKALYDTGCLLYKKGKITQLRKNIPETIGGRGKSFTRCVDAFCFALSHGQMEIAEFFIDCGILDSDALFSVIKYPKLFLRMLERGIQPDKTESSITSLFLHLEDVWDETWASIVRRMDLPLKEHGGPALCYAAQGGHMALAEFLLSSGVPVNCMNRSRNTPILCAAKNHQLRMVKYLTEQGADLTLTNNRGIRPYIAARMNNCIQMAEYIRSHEPEELHSEKVRKQLFEAYHVPGEMQEYLKSENLKLEFPEEESLHWIRFFSYMDVPEISYQGKKGLSLVQDSEDFDFMLLWEPDSEKIWFLDMEHDVFHAVSTWPEFIQNAGRYVNRAVYWEFD